MRRRALMSMGSKGEDDPWAGLPNGIRIRTQNALKPSGFGSTNIVGDVGQLSNINELYIDGVQVTPVANYVFDDDTPHNVLIVPKNFTDTLPPIIGYYNASPISYIDIPENVTNIFMQALRGFDTAIDCALIIRSKSVVTFGNANFTGTPSKGTIYVPTNLVDGYKALFTAGNNNFPAGYVDRIFALEDSPYK